MERHHTHREFETELREVQDRLLKMGGRVEEMIARAVAAVVELDAVSAEATIALDAEVNADEIATDELCLAVLARRQPLAGDLRLIATSLKMVTDLERMGDLAVNVCERVALLVAEPGPVPELQGLAQMGRAVRQMLRDALDAFVRRDQALAQAVIDGDDDVDEAYHRVLREMLARMSKDPSLLQRGIQVQAIAKLLERFGDHATNVAEEVVFLVSAHDIRHAGKRGLGERKP